MPNKPSHHDLRVTVGPRPELVEGLRKLKRSFRVGQPPADLVALAAELQRELREYERMVVHAAHEHAGMSWREIAHALGEPLGTVHGRYNPPQKKA